LHFFGLVAVNEKPAAHISQSAPLAAQVVHDSYPFIHYLHSFGLVAVNE